MMSKTVGEDNWGERNLTRRNRLQWAIRGTAIALGLAFAVGMRSLDATHAVTRGTGAIIAVAFVVAIGVLGWMSWQRHDEIQRRIAINAYAIMGLVCLMLMPLARGVGPLIGLSEPMLTVFVIAVMTVPISVVVQRERG